ncbi:hypothetical protein J6590_055225 [Homalodisca vitripennis]|nr:hypothetical protein J6590_055225 [Homalodisca vitripennis]
MCQQTREHKYTTSIMQRGEDVVLVGEYYHRYTKQSDDAVQEEVPDKASAPVEVWRDSSHELKMFTRCGPLYCWQQDEHCHDTEETLGHAHGPLVTDVLPKVERRLDASVFLSAINVQSKIF